MNSQRGISGRAFSYSDEDHLLTAGSATYQYDLDGFLTTKTEGSEITQYQYSSRGELLRVDLPDGRVIEYLHDPLGRRIAKKVEGTITEKYLWQGMTRLLAVFDGSDNLLMRFEYADDRLPATVMKEGVKYYLAYDQVGSLRAISDSAGNVVKLVEYDSFGNIVSETAPSFLIPFGFAGGLHDRDTSIVRFGYREYDPDIGRWTAKDPIGFACGDTDLYGYVLNDPINAIDPDGLIWVTIGYDRQPNKSNNWLRALLNRIANIIGSGGEKGLSPEDLEGWEQYVIQEWQYDFENPCRNNDHTVGARRKIKQTYKFKTVSDGEQIWDKNSTHYWEPQVPNYTYHEYPDVRIEGDLQFYGTGAGDIP